jgi:hypothetical protein
MPAALGRAYLLLILEFGGALWPSCAFAYRPFDSTDPAVAALGEFEVELSPVSFRHEDGGTTWIAPQLRLNYGFAHDWEVVLEGQGEYPHHQIGELVENALSLKSVLREGSLQDKNGPSIATELSLLLPGIHSESATGVAITGIVGQSWAWGAIHFNAAAELSRDQRAGIFLGVILEGPGASKVRPVAEVIYQREFGREEEVAGLIGLIWQMKEALAFDFAVRQAGIDGRPETEIRAGLTFAFPVR